MPHPSNPLDDIRAGSLYREHGFFRSLEDVWLVSVAAPAKDASDSGQRAQRSSDGLSTSSFYLESYPTFAVLKIF